MKDIKYKDYHFGEYVFTVRFQRRYDLGEPAVDVEVFEQHTPRKGLIHRLIDFFKYNRYWNGTWMPCDGETLEEYALRLCDFVVNAMEEVENVEKFWDDLDK